MEFNKKSCKGMIGVDLAISVVVISIFASIIGLLIYNIYLSINGSKRNTVALEYVISVLEKSKEVPYNDLNMNNIENTIKSIPKLSSITTINNGTTLNSNNEYEYIGKMGGYTVNVKVEKYNALPDNKYKELEDKIKIVKVNVQYNLGQKKQNVEISTIVTR